jgi:transposase
MLAPDPRQLRRSQAEIPLIALPDFARPPLSGIRVWLSTGTTDMRRGMNSLALQVQQALGRDPHGGDFYVFRGRRGKHTTFHIQIASRDNCVSLAPSIWANAASIASSAQ